MADNRKPLNGYDECACGCKRIPSELHEPYCGRNRQLSIKYKMVYSVSQYCHTEIHKNPKGPKDLKLRQMAREYFEKTYPDLDFIEVFK